MLSAWDEGERKKAINKIEEKIFMPMTSHRVYVGSMNILAKNKRVNAQKNKAGPCERRLPNK